ncbi:hypothetical protein L209DRAFT_210494 [Thermothelomyces heterothallicus CBS 203.75]
MLASYMSVLICIKPTAGFKHGKKIKLCSEHTRTCDCTRHSIVSPACRQKKHGRIALCYQRCLVTLAMKACSSLCGAG